MAIEVGSYRRRKASSGIVVTQIKHLVDVNFSGWDRFSRSKTQTTKELTLGRVNVEAPYLGIKGRHLDEIGISLTHKGKVTGVYREDIPVVTLDQVAKLVEPLEKLNLTAVLGINPYSFFNAYDLVKTVLAKSQNVARDPMVDRPIKEGLCKDFIRLEDNIQKMVGSEVYNRAVRLWANKHR